MKMSLGEDSKSPAKSVERSNIKCVLVGDTMVGKTSLARRLASHAFPAVYTPTMFDNYAATTSVDGKSFVLGLFDTAGQEEFDRLRTLAYVNCDVFLVCFSVMCPDSLHHVQDGWLSEVRAHAPHAPWVLVGTHIDQRDEAKTSGQRTPGAGGCVSTREGVAVAHKLGAESYVECSALTEAGIRRLEEAAIEAVVNGSAATGGDDCQCACTIM